MTLEVHEKSKTQQQRAPTVSESDVVFLGSGGKFAEKFAETAFFQSECFHCFIYAEEAYRLTFQCMEKATSLDHHSFRPIISKLQSIFFFLNYIIVIISFLF